ncbi:MAG: FIG00761799: membrane protein [uncultured Sulfurovum sp.]|uniref:FIG00761799: membrane protein n=1 Tax=uncultured Sulfurovum sp. TaxID=269237 RepID=A0A6S6TJE1_9BACT|nr:MAG: FIG00761799: membrane protein [uncultured Sulfurovum sp.]
MKKKVIYFILLFLFSITWIWAAIEPLYYDDWVLENILVLLFIVLILLTGRLFEFSIVSYVFMTTFMVLHVIGSHYTYAEVPWGFTLGEWLGTERNMYDRLVHLLFGVLFVYPVREMSVRIAKTKGFWGYFVPFMIVSSFAGFYEIVEWGVAVVVDPESGTAFLGTQGDIWDAQKDMFLAIVGSFVTLLMVMIVYMIYNRDFYHEFKESFKLPKDDKPMGEVLLDEMMKNMTKENK